jgi:hypothetical protein
MRGALLALALAAGCASPAKFQRLAYPVRAWGEVVAVSGTDIDIKLDPAHGGWLERLFPDFGVLHIERYGYPYQPEDPHDGPIPAVGDRIGVTGALVLDSSVHQEERQAHPDRVISDGPAGLARAWIAKPEMHPYWPGSLVVGEPPGPMVALPVNYCAETWALTWLWERLLDRGGTCVDTSWRTETILVGAPAAHP